jgi:alpha-amylase
MGQLVVANGVLRARGTPFVMQRRRSMNRSRNGDEGVAMKRRVGLLILACLLAACSPASGEPATSPAGATPPPAPTQMSIPASPTPAPADIVPSPSLTLTAEPAAWWDDAAGGGLGVFYEVFPRSFYDSDGDGSGDLPGLIEKLDYLNDGDPEAGTDLGVMGLWLMPVFASPSYHGYDVTDYYTVNPDYGTNEDLKHLIDQAHQRGMRVIVDLVLNHTSDQHPWFEDSASGPDAERREWYIWSETDPGYLGPWGEPVWHPKNGAYYYGVFWSGMPDLNLENPEVTTELYEIARYWLEEVGFDGFRLDAARHYVEDGKDQVHTSGTHAWLQGFNAFSKGVNPEALTVGEIWDMSDAVATYVGTDVDLAFEFTLAKAILTSVNEGSAAALASAMKEMQRLYPEGGYATFLTNHDQNRVMAQLGRDPDKAKLAATILLTLPGVPFVYYGEEIGMTGSKPDERIRTPMQWSAEPNAGFTAGEPWQPFEEDADGRYLYEQWNADVELADGESLLNHYRKLIAARNNHAALRGLGFQALESGAAKVYAYLRHVPDEAILVVVNFDDEATSEYALSLDDAPLVAGRYAAVDLLTGTGVAPLLVEADRAIGGYQPFPELAPQDAVVLQLTDEGR